MIKKLTFFFLVALFFVSCAPDPTKPYGNIFQAIQKNDIAAVKAFVKKNPHILNEQNAVNKNYPLHESLLPKKPEIARWLIEEGADCNVKNGTGETPFQIVILQGDKELLSLMIKKGANVNAQGYAGFSPLQRACMIPDRKEIAQLLLEKGAKVDQQDENGITPLMSASGWGFKDLVALLLEKGADISIKDKNGRSALDFATLKNRKEVIELLKAKGARPSEKTDSGISVSESLITITRQSA